MTPVSIDFQNLFRKSPNPCLVMDRSLVIVTANDSYLSLVRRTLDDLSGKLIWDALSVEPEARRLSLISMEKVIRTRQPDEMDLIRYDFPDISAPDGRRLRRYWRVTHAPVLDAAGEVHCLLQQATDVTSEKLLREAVVERSTIALLYENIVQSDVSPVAAWDADYRLIAFNRAHNREYWQIYGIEQQVGDCLLDPLLPDEADILRVHMDRALAGESFVVREEFDNLARGRACWEIAYNPLRDDAGRIIGAFHHAADVTSELRAAADLADAQGALRQSQKMEAVGQLTGGLAHDFNNLLTGVMGNLEVMQSRVARGQTDDLDRLIAASQAASRRAASLTQRLLAFSRRQTLDPKPTNVNRLIAGMEDLLRRTMGPSHAITVSDASDLWIADIDGAQLENALLNLCINARDAMPDGGQLTIETRNRWFDERDARDRELPPGPYLSISVADTGVGMDRNTIDRAFEPFFTTKPIGEGTGLGLSMVYGFARQSHGQVWITSEPGRGTVVSLYLPRYFGEAFANEDPDEPEATSADASGAQKILLVDDEASIRHLIDEVLDEAGYTVIGVADGPSGVRVLQSDPSIDLLITDVGLPGGMNGRQVADAARALRPELGILFITGFAAQAAIGGPHLDDRMQLLTKPFTMAALLNKVAEMTRVEGASSSGV